MGKKFGYVISFLITWWGIPFRVSASRQKGSQIVTFDVHFVVGFLEHLGPLSELIRERIIRVLHAAAMASHPLNLDHTKEDGGGVMINQPLALCQVRSRISFAFGNPNFGQLWGKALQSKRFHPRDCRIEGTDENKITLGVLIQRQVDSK